MLNEKNINDLLLKAIENTYTFVIVDTNGIVIHMSDKYASLLGLEQEEAIGQHITKLLPNSKLHKVIATGKAEPQSLLTFHNKKTDEDLTMVCSRIPIFDGDEVVGAISTTTLNNLDELESINRELAKLKQANENYLHQLNELRENKFSLNNVLGEAPSIQEIKELVLKIADSNLSVLITGETGTGKEVFANAIHQLSRRSQNNFIKINCAAIPKDLLESELFGYSEGAFSGASKGGKIGKFELANNGTILLDEIGEMPLSLQSKLLRVIQEQELVRVGGVKTIKLNVRLICSTNQNIENMVADGTFREDLYYRINVVELPIPPLREHLDDIPLLCKHFIEDSNISNGINVTGINSNVYPLLQSYQWKGNIRELKHAVERACVMCSAGELQTNHFDFLISKMDKKISKESLPSQETLTLRSKRKQYEKEEILKALQLTNWNKSAAAKYLNISRSVFYTKLKNYGIQ